MKKLFQPASPEALFVLGLFSLPGFLFQEKLLYQTLNALLFLLLAYSSGKRILLLPAFFLLISVTAAALLVPYGRVLGHIGVFPITEGALKFGISRSILLLGLIYLSKFSVVRGLLLPGTAGRRIAKVFFYFERFSENCVKFSFKDLAGGLDNLLLAVAEIESDGNYASQTKKDQRPLLLFPVTVSLICWVLLIL